jgi:hypothetical protein
MAPALYPLAAIKVEALYKVNFTPIGSKAPIRCGVVRE